MTRKRLWACLAALCLLSACSGGSGAAGGDTGGTGGGHPQPQDQPIVENEDLTAGLTGADADDNGIRDDIDRLIADRYSSSPALKKAAEQSARALQKLLLAQTREEALLAADEDSRAVECLSRTLPADVAGNNEKLLRLSREMEALTANTQERFTRYAQANELLDGMVAAPATDAVCD